MPKSLKHEALLQGLTLNPKTFTKLSCNPLKTLKKGPAQLKQLNAASSSTAGMHRPFPIEAKTGLLLRNLIQATIIKIPIPVILSKFLNQNPDNPRRIISHGSALAGKFSFDTVLYLPRRFLGPLGGLAPP